MGPSILVIDDDPCLRDLLRLHLSGAGYEVRIAPDAIAGGYAILERAPDLLILDINMPYMDGVQLGATLIADLTLPVFPVIFLSSDESRIEIAYQVGAAACLRKPISKDDLLLAVARALDQARLAARAAA
ncbi:MAG TPA: response regulator [Burkholderiales bacterium]|nr:response regulator [Burkholderiales bacterium]